MAPAPPSRADEDRCLLKGITMTAPAIESGRDRRSVAVLVMLIALFAASVWNWLYNIPVLPNVEIPFTRDSWWFIDKDHPQEIMTLGNFGPVSFYDLRTGQHLFDRLFETDAHIRPVLGDSSWTLIFRGGIATVVDLREDRVRFQLPSVPHGAKFRAFADGKVLIAYADGKAQAFDGTKGGLLWSRDDILEIRPTYAAAGDRFCAEVDVPRVYEGKTYHDKKLQVLLAADGQQDMRWAKTWAVRQWITSPPQFLVENGGGATAEVYDLETGQKRISTGMLGQNADPYFNSNLTELLVPYRFNKYGCRLASWDTATGADKHPLPVGAEVVTDFITDDGRYSIGKFMVDFPPGYGRLRSALAVIGIQIAPRETETPLLVDNSTGRVVGRLEHDTLFNRLSMTDRGDAFLQRCDDRLAVYFLPLRHNWQKLITGGLFMLVSFAATAFKLRPFLYYLAGNEIIPTQKRRDDRDDLEDQRA